jgi:hypothetical protein
MRMITGKPEFIRRHEERRSIAEAGRLNFNEAISLLSG